MNKEEIKTISEYIQNRCKELKIDIKKNFNTSQSTGSETIKKK
jgi:hypothetical protein